MVSCEFIWLQSDIISLVLQKTESGSVCSDLVTAQIPCPEITDSTHSSALIIKYAST